MSVGAGDVGAGGGEQDAALVDQGLEEGCQRPAAFGAVCMCICVFCWWR